MLIGIGFVKLNRKIIKQLTIIVFLFVTVMLVQLTQKQTLVWKNNLTFWAYVVTLSPENVHAQFHLGDAYVGIGEYEKAIEHYHKAMFLEPQNKWKYAVNLPIAYIELNKLEEALKILNQLVEHSVPIKEVGDHFYYMVGVKYLKQGFLHKAQYSFKKALELNPKNQKAQELYFDLQKNRK